MIGRERAVSWRILSFPGVAGVLWCYGEPGLSSALASAASTCSASSRITGGSTSTKLSLNPLQSLCLQRQCFESGGEGVKSEPMDFPISGHKSYGMNKLMEKTSPTGRNILRLKEHE